MINFANYIKRVLKELNPILQINGDSLEIINKILNVGGKEFIDTLDETLVTFLIKNSENPEQVKELFQKYGKLPKDGTTTPINEIFKSLTSLQEELTEQRKETIKENNLMKFQNFIKKRKINQ